MAEGVPLGAALQRQRDQHHRRTGSAYFLPGTVCLPGNGVRARREHGVDRVPATTEQAVLRTVTVKVETEGEHLAALHEAWAAALRSSSPT